MPDRAAIKLFWDVKKKIQNEFGVRLQLNQDDIVDQIAGYGVKSEDNQLKSLITELVKSLEECRSETNDKVIAAASGDTIQSLEPAKKAPRLYRGQPIHE